MTIEELSKRILELEEELTRTESTYASNPEVSEQIIKYGIELANLILSNKT